MTGGLATRPLGKQGLHASAQGLGCMSLTKGFYAGDADLGPEADRIAVITTALESGITLLDTADLYGPYDNHILIGAPCTHLQVCTNSHSSSTGFWTPHEFLPVGCDHW